MEKTSKVLTYIYMLPLTLALVLVAFLSIWKSVYFPLEQKALDPYYAKDHPLLLILIFILAAALFYALRRYAPFFKQGKLPEAVPVIAAGLLSLFFLFSFRSQPYMDSMAIDAIAKEFLKGDFSALQGTGDSYLRVYPFQIGFIAYVELIYRIFGSGNYLAVQLFNVLFVMLQVHFLYGICDLVFEKSGLKGAKEIFAILSFFMLPLYIFVTFVYGDIVGPTLGIGGMYMVFRFLQNGQKKDVVFGAVCISLGVMLKSNTLIFLAAMVIILVLESLRRKKLSLLLPAAIFVAAVFLLGQLVNLSYAKAAGIDQMPEGAPKTAWVAMGLHNDGYGEYGWYDGTNTNTFQAVGYDRDKANAIAVADIWSSIHRIRSDPFNGAYFFYRKFASSWNEPQYNAQIMAEWGSRHVEHLPAVGRSMIYGVGRQVLYQIMNSLHFIVFACAALLAISLFYHYRREAAYYLLPVLGGMLFHLVWETNSRYIMPYYIYLFPAAAGGMALLLSFIEGKRRSRKRS